MNKNAIKSIEFYCESEICALKKSEFLSKIIILSNLHNYDVDLSVGEVLGIKKNKFPKVIYLSVSVLDKKKNIVLANPVDNEHLTDVAKILEIDKKGRVSFFTWQEDEEFIDSLNWIANELEKINNKNQ